MQDEPQFLTLGTIVAAHGVHGELRVQVAMDDPEFLRDCESIYLDEDGEPHLVPLESFRMRSENQALVKLGGVDDRDAAEALRDARLLVERAWTPPLDADEYYVADILGLQVVTVDGEPLGRVREVMFTGSNEVYVIRGGPRGEILLPAIADVVEQVDLEAGQIRVRLPEGLI